MGKYDYGCEPVIVSRDCGYNIVELLSPENRMRAKQRANNPNIVTGKHKLKELFAEIGIVVIPDKMCYLYK